MTALFIVHVHCLITCAMRDANIILDMDEGIVCLIDSIAHCIYMDSILLVSTSSDSDSLDFPFENSGIFNLTP